MLVSYDRSFLFIHVDKAAGSSVQLALQPYAAPRLDSRLRRRMVWLGTANRLGALYRRVEFPVHVTARTVRRCLPPPLYDSLFKFAFVRNPWDRLVSRYAHLLRSTDHPRHGLVSRMTDFSEYLHWEIHRGKMHQWRFTADADGRTIVDFIGRYERLKEDFGIICARLNIQADLPHANISAHRDYRTYYTPETRDLVAKHFQRDIELFGYEFDGIATSKGEVRLEPAWQPSFKNDAA
jgi:hypothetical protein